jgi:hypothetical protein
MVTMERRISSSIEVASELAVGVVVFQTMVAIG